MQRKGHDEILIPLKADCTKKNEIFCILNINNHALINVIPLNEGNFIGEFGILCNSASPSVFQAHSSQTSYVVRSIVMEFLASAPGFI
jgi:hypothetical protein